MRFWFLDRITIEDDKALPSADPIDFGLLLNQGKQLFIVQ